MIQEIQKRLVLITDGSSPSTDRQSAKSYLLKEELNPQYFEALISLIAKSTISLSTNKHIFARLLQISKNQIIFDLRHSLKRKKNIINKIFDLSQRCLVPKALSIEYRQFIRNYFSTQLRLEQFSKNMIFCNWDQEDQVVKLLHFLLGLCTGLNLNDLRSKLKTFIMRYLLQLNEYQTIKNSWICKYYYIKIATKIQMDYSNQYLINFNIYPTLLSCLFSVHNEYDKTNYIESQSLKQQQFCYHHSKKWANKLWLFLLIQHNVRGYDNSYLYRTNQQQLTYILTPYIEHFICQLQVPTSPRVRIYQLKSFLQIVKSEVIDIQWFELILFKIIPSIQPDDELSISLQRKVMILGQKRCQIGKKQPNEENIFTLWLSFLNIWKSKINTKQKYGSQIIIIFMQNLLFSENETQLFFVLTLIKMIINSYCTNLDTIISQINVYQLINKFVLNMRQRKDSIQFMSVIIISEIGQLELCINAISATILLQLFRHILKTNTQKIILKSVSKVFVNLSCRYINYGIKIEQAKHVTDLILQFLSQSISTDLLQSLENIMTWKLLEQEYLSNITRKLLAIYRQTYIKLKLSELKNQNYYQIETAGKLLIRVIRLIAIDQNSSHFLRQQIGTNILSNLIELATIRLYQQILFQALLQKQISNGQLYFKFLIFILSIIVKTADFKHYIETLPFSEFQIRQLKRTAVKIDENHSGQFGQTFLGFLKNYIKQKGQSKANSQQIKYQILVPFSFLFDTKPTFLLCKYLLLSIYQYCPEQALQHYYCQFKRIKEFNQEEIFSRNTSDIQNIIQLQLCSYQFKYYPMASPIFQTTLDNLQFYHLLLSFSRRYLTFYQTRKIMSGITTALFLTIQKQIVSVTQKQESLLNMIIKLLIHCLRQTYYLPNVEINELYSQTQTNINQWRNYLQNNQMFICSEQYLFALSLLKNFRKNKAEMFENCLNLFQIDQKTAILDLMVKRKVK